MRKLQVDRSFVQLLRIVSCVYMHLELDLWRSKCFSRECGDESLYTIVTSCGKFVMLSHMMPIYNMICSLDYRRSTCDRVTMW